MKEIHLILMAQDGLVSVLPTGSPQETTENKISKWLMRSDFMPKAGILGKSQNTEA